MENAFEIKNLNLYYAQNHALTNVNMDIRKNAVTAFIGPSGCGKSTLLRCFNRMNDLIPECHIEGEIFIGGKDLLSKETNVVDLRTKVGMVFQKPNPFPMSIFENVAYGLRCQGLKDKSQLKSIVEESLKKAALWSEVKDRLHTNAYKLSGGQQQRLCIARAIAMAPEVILMDEPTSSLDPIATAKIEELIQNLKREYTIIVVTHSMQQATRISDDTAFFLMGEIIEKSPTKTLFTIPADKRTEDYITGRFG